MAGREPTSLGQSEVKAKTEKAMLVVTESGDELWIPFSVIHDDSELYEDANTNTGELVVFQWFAEKEELV